MKRLLSWLVLPSLIACGGTTTPVKKPDNTLDKPLPTLAKEEPEPPKEKPPESSPARPFAAAKATWAELGNGLKIVSRRDRTIPIAHLRLAIQAGSSMDGERTGIAALCAKAVASSGAGAMTDTQFTSKLESLGASLKVEVYADGIVYGVSVVKDRMSDAMDLLAQIATKPRLKNDDVLRIQKQLVEEAADNAKGDGHWNAMMVLYRDLFELPSEHHPYASYDATSDDLEKLKPADCQKWHKQFFVPNNMLVAASGDVDPDELKAAATKGFGAARKGVVPTISFTDPMPQRSTKITLVDRPSSLQSEVVVGTLAAKRGETDYPSFLVAGHVLGGAFTGRLFQDIRQKRGLAYITYTSIDAFANSPSVFYLYGQTQTSSTADTLTALLEHAQKLAAEGPTETEGQTASQFIIGMRSLDAGMPGVTASELAESWLNKQSDDAQEELFKGIRQATPDSMRKAFAEHVRQGHLSIVVSGDAATVGPMLQSFGEVKVVDPTRNFTRMKTLPPVAPK